MKYQCFNCRRVWGEGNPEVEGYSHGLCVRCTKEALARTYRKQQLAEGNFDCFAKSSGFCDQIFCRYREICLKPEPPMELGPMLNELPAGYAKQERYVEYECTAQIDFS
jgi:hypothetical protein